MGEKWAEERKYGGKVSDWQKYQQPQKTESINKQKNLFPSEKERKKAKILDIERKTYETFFFRYQTFTLIFPALFAVS